MHHNKEGENMIIPSQLKEGQVLKRLGDTTIQFTKGNCYKIYQKDWELWLTSESKNDLRVGNLDIELWELVETKQFTKDDSVKILLTDMNFTEIYKVLQFGAKKYTPNNWQKCDDKKRYTNAMLRHVFAYLNGEKIDSDSGLHHLAHAATNCLFLVFFDKNEGDK
jgi:hypothetical protein